jgi:1,4-alpha-glucan branching enzyme
LNFGNRGYARYALGFPRIGMWRARLNSDWNGYSSDFSNWLACDTDANGTFMDNMPTSANVGSGSYSFLVLSQD